jgi:hypothetical protein
MSTLVLDALGKFTNIIKLALRYKSLNNILLHVYICYVTIVGFYKHENHY